MRRSVESLGGCFVANTLVHTDRGLRAIQHLRPGERVLSQPQGRGRLAWRRIGKTFVFKDQPVWLLRFRRASGEQDFLHGTPNHPFWVSREGWTALQNLRPGNALELSNGATATVLSAHNTGHTATVYNMEVDGFHTYYVGEAGVWVHNADCGARSRELNVGDVHKQSGHKVLAKIPFAESVDSRAGMPKASPSGEPPEMHYYENPGTHDPYGGRENYKQDKSVLPKDHVELFMQSKPFVMGNGSVALFVKDSKGQIHRFEESLGTESGRPIFHWSGSIDGRFLNGKPRKLSVDSVVRKFFKWKQ